MPGGTQTMDDWGPVFKTGGIAAIALAVVQALAKLIAWLLNWNKAREEGHAAELRAREEAVTAREVIYAEKLDNRISGLEDTVDRQAKVITELSKGYHSLRNVTLEVTVELRTHAPGSRALARAEAHLREIYPMYGQPVNHDISSFGDALDRLNKKGGQDDQEA
jgi:hypothetical protein